MFRLFLWAYFYQAKLCNHLSHELQSRTGKEAEGGAQQVAARLTVPSAVFFFFFLRKEVVKSLLFLIIIIILSLIDTIW